MNQVFLSDTILDRLRKHPETVRLYLEGMSALHRSGILEYLRALGRPLLPDRGKDINMAAASAANASGYNAALDDLVLFQERYLTQQVTGKLEMNYGSVETALQLGDITKEEADAIRSGESVNYEALQRKLNPPTSAAKSKSDSGPGHGGTPAK